jgi:spoIIIJ-associated protein
MSQNQAKKAKEIVDNFLAALGVSATAKVFEVEEYLKIEIEGKDTSLLIGYHGDNLRSLKHLLSIILRRNLAENTIITIDVGGYLAGKEERVREMARKAAQKFEKTKRPQDLPPMNSFERRIAHSELSELGYSSESAGEGLDRHIVVKK